MMAVVLISLLVVLVAGCGPEAPPHRVVADDDGAVRLATAEVTGGEVRFFTFRQGGKNVSFLVRTDRKGVLRVHLDACYSCFRYRRGFVVEGSDLLCVACRYTYSIGDEVWDFQGACAPIPIRSSVEAGELVIERAVLEKAARYF